MISVSPSSFVFSALANLCSAYFSDCLILLFCAFNNSQADLYAKDGELFKAAPLAMRADKGVLLRVCTGNGLLLALAMP